MTPILQAPRGLTRSMVLQYFFFPKKTISLDNHFARDCFFLQKKCRTTALEETPFRPTFLLALASLDTRRKVSLRNTPILINFIPPAFRFLCSQIRTQKLIRHGIIKSTLYFFFSS